MKYTFYVATSHSGGEGQVNKHVDVYKYGQTNLIGQAGTPMGIPTTQPIGLGFSQI